MRTSLLGVLLSAALSGCLGSGQVSYSAQADVTPALVTISPGVQVVEDYDEPVFYSENYYWRYDAGVWYRSPHHTRGWVRVETVPVAVRQIDRPTAYVHYRGGARVEARDHREGPPPPPVRDHREGPPPPPAVRDHREEKEERKEQNEERKEERKEQKEERKEQKEERKEHKDEKKDDKKDHGHH